MNYYRMIKYEHRAFVSVSYFRVLSLHSKSVLVKEGGIIQGMCEYNYMYIYGIYFKASFISNPAFTFKYTPWLIQMDQLIVTDMTEKIKSLLSKMVKQLLKMVGTLQLISV